MAPEIVMSPSEVVRERSSVTLKYPLMFAFEVLRLILLAAKDYSMDIRNQNQPGGASKEKVRTSTMMGVETVDISKEWNCALC